MAKSINAMVFWVLFVTVVFSSCATAQITNGDFNTPDLSGWVVESGAVTDGGGYALFEQGGYDELAILSQEFTMPDGALTLSFDVEMVLEDEEGPGPETDIFTAYLYDSSTNDPLGSISSDGEFFYMDNKDLIGFDSRTVSLDVSGFDVDNAYLVFKLDSDLDDRTLTKVGLDNVNISIIPAPGALLMCVVGAGVVGWLRRRGLTK
jgi:hypothetical protein